MFVNKIKKVVKFVFVSFALACAFSIYFACDIGLGGAVDTEAPTGTITSPGVNAIIRDAFAIQGTWADDGSVGQVTVSLRNTTTNAINTYNASVDGAGTWLCAVNPMDGSQPLVDGTYLATVTIYDNGGHTSTLTRSYTVDNTAPVVIISKPKSTVTTTDSIEVYGQNVTLAGRAADESNISKIEMVFYSDEACATASLATITANNVPATIDLNIASFEETVNNDYSAIYGSTGKNGSVPRYCKIYAYDGAQRYPADGSSQSASDTIGNVQSIYYLSSKVTKAGLDTYKITELYSMFAGNYAGTTPQANGVSISDVLNKLNEIKDSVGKFNLNPANNPTYLVYDEYDFKNDGNFKDLTDGSSATIKVSEGLDGIELNYSTLRVYAVPCIWDSTNNVLSENSSKYYLTGEWDDSKTTFTAKMSSNKPDFVTGVTYKFGVDGSDLKGNPIVPSNTTGYAFYFGASGGAPKLNSSITFKRPGDADFTASSDVMPYLPAGTTVKLSGTVVVEDGTPILTLKLTNNSSITHTEEISVTPKTDDAGNPVEGEFTFSKEFASTDFASTTAQYSVSLTAKRFIGSNSKETNTTYNFFYDTQAPKMEISTVNPVAKKYLDEAGSIEKNGTEDKKYLNGTVSIQIFSTDDTGRFSEDASKKAKLEVFEGTNPSTDTLKDTKEISSPANSTVEVDTTGIATGQITIRLTLYDYAGNKFVKDITDYFVDQETDKPVILPNPTSNITFGINSEEDLKNSTTSQNIFSSGSQVILTLIDDDGLNEIVPYKNGQPDITQKQNFNSTTNSTYAYTLPIDAGIVSLKFVLNDNKGNTTTVPYSGEIFVKVTGGAPSIELASAVRKPDPTVADGYKKLETLYTKGDTADGSNYFANTITIDSVYDNFDVYRAIVDLNTTPNINDFSKINAINGKTYTDEDRPTESKDYYYYVVATEDNVKGTAKKITCKVDKILPTVTLKALPGKDDTAASSDSFTFGGTSGDTGGSGVEEVWLTITDVVSRETNTVKATDTTSWACTVTYASFGNVFTNEGEKKISVKAVDAAGNESASLEQTFLYDLNVPEIEEIKVGNTDFVSGYMPSTGYNLSFKAKDSYQLNNFVVKQVFTPTTGTSVPKEYVFYENTGTDSEIETTLKIPYSPSNPTDTTYTPQEGTYTYQFTVTDKKGNEVSSQTFECIVDLTPPVVTINNQNYKGQNAISKTSFPFDGDIVETNSMSGVYYAIVPEGEPVPTPPESNVLFDNVWTSAKFTKVSSFGTTAWKTQQPFATTEDLNATPKVYKEGVNYKIIVYAVDKAGNVGPVDASGEAKAAEMTFDVDMSKPTLTALAKLTDEATEEKIIYNISNLENNAGSFIVKGTASDTHGINKVIINVKEAGSSSTGTDFPINAGDSTNFNWLKDFVFGSASSGENKLSDGVYTFTVTAYDLVGKTDIKELSITVDTVKPTVTSDTDYPKLDDSKFDASKWYDSKTLPLEVKVSDGTAGSGIKSVRTSTDGTNWKVISLVDGKKDIFTGNIQLSNLSAEGKQIFYVKAIDNANNESEVMSCEVQVDTTAPNLEYTKYKIGDDFSTATFINGTKSLTVYGTYADTQSGVQALTFTGTVGDGTDENNKPKYKQPVVSYSTEPNPETITDESKWKEFSALTDEEKKGSLSWRAVFENSIISETGEIHVIGKNNAGEGLETDKKLFKLNKDTQAPQLTNIKITPSLSEYSVVEKTEGTVTVYYLNNTKGTFSFTGLAEDKEKVNETTGKKEQEASGVSKVTLSIQGLAEQKQPASQPTAYFSGIDLSEIPGDGTVATITVTDNAGNEFQKQLTIKFDTAGPVGVHQFDKKGKDLYFRIGDQDNDVGGKYSPDTYGKLNTIKIRGKFEDVLTEPAIFYYKVFDHSPDSTDLAAVLSNYENKTYSYFNGNFPPLGTPETKSVEYTDDSDVRKTENIVSNYKTTIADLQEGSNYVVILAVDKVGNPAIEEITAKDGTKYNCYKINVDQTAPEITCDETETKYTNAEADWTLSGTYKDGASWLAENGISLTLGSEWKISGTSTKLTDVSIISNEFTSDTLKDEKYDYLTKGNHARIKIIKDADTYSYHEVTNTDSPKTTGKITFSPAVTAGTYTVELGSGTWSTTITKATLQGLAGQTKTISAVATDTAGMSVSVPLLATVIVDREYPKVEIGTLGSIINKKVPVTITASDNTGLKSVQFQYKKHSDSAWTTYQTKTLSSNNNLDTWTLELDTEDSRFTDETDYDFRAIATDLADNTGNSQANRTDSDNSVLDSRTKSAKISQDSDRPIIKFENWTFQPYEEDSLTKFPLGKTELTFTVEDDDGVDEGKVFYQFTKLTVTSVTEDDANWKSKASTDTKLSYDSVNHKFKISGIDEAEWKIWFKIEDKKAEVFISSSSTNKPKLQDSDNSAEYDSALILRVDSKPPRVDDVKWLRVKADGAAYAETDWQEKDSISAKKFGGIAAKNMNKFQISLYAYDENPIKSVKLTIPQVSGDAADAVYEYSFTDTNKDGFNSSIRGSLIKKRVADGYGLWITGDIDVSKYKTSKRTCKVTVDDGVNPNSDTTFDLIIDNSGPKLEGAVSPDSTEQIVGTFKIRSALVDKEGDILGVGVDADEVKYYIPKSSETDATVVVENKWKETSSGTLNLTIEISDLNITIGYDSVSESVSDDYTAYLSGELYQIPVWIRLKDTYGNVTFDTSSISIRYNPNADKPMISIIDPVHDTPTASPAYVIAGGKLKISGTASDNVGIKAVYLQFDMDGDGVYENGAGVTGAPADITLEDIPNKTENGVQLQGVKASGTESWSCSVNILDLTDLNTEAKHLKIRAIAVDKGHKTEAEDLCSAWSDVLHVLVDNIKPQFSTPELRCYDSAITSSADVESYSARKDYSKNMYIKTSDQHWYIYGEVLVKDENYISGLVVSGSESGTWTGANGTGTASGDIISWSSDGGKTHQFLIPVTQDNGKTVWETTITAKGKNINDNKNENEDEYKINIDNTASKFSDEYDGNEVDTYGSIKLYKNSYGGHVLLPNSTGNKTLCNDNANFVTIAGKITEKDSGFDKLVFYFERVSKSKYYLINTGDFALSKATSDLTATDGLPVKSITTGITRDGEYKVGVTSLPDFVRVGGLVKIGGDYRRITKIEDTEITFDTACPVKFNDKVEFVYAMVIDSNNETLTTTNSTSTLDETDGDGLYEKYKPDGNDYIWEIAVNSKNIPDGPITIHCAVIDKAGNISTGYTKTYISNNPPRITSVYLGTDVNADGKYTFTDSDTTSEFKQFFVKDTETTNKIDVWNLEAKINSKFWTAKKNLVVIPEFVGGNGYIYYRYSKKTGSAGEKLSEAEPGTKEGTTPTLAKLLSSSDSIEGKTLDEIKSDSSNSNGIIILENDLSETPVEDTLGKITKTGDYEKDSNDGVNVYRFSFWDSTEGCDVGSDSQWCVLNITMAQDLYDGTAPYGNITPFYWKGTGNKKSSVVFSGSTPQGHIELEGDLPSDFTSTGTGVMDRDPKVSGKIKIEGEAYDETMLKSITVTFDNHSVTATYDSSAATADEKWTYTTNSADFSLAVTDANGPTQDGHSVTWEYTVDTSKASKVAKTDVIVKVEVRDASAANSGAGNANTPGNVSTKRESDGTTKRQDKGVNLSGYYKVDVVPYISSLSTTLSSLERKRPSITGRTATGKYPVYSYRKNASGVAEYETITVNGFNLSGGKVKLYGDSSDTTDDVEITLGADLKFTLTSAVKSGKLSVINEEIESLNNLNNDDSKDKYVDDSEEETLYGNYKNYYNRQPNDTNNDRLTDDVELIVWDFNAQAVLATSSLISEPIMHINPTNGMLGFGFLSGAERASYPNGTTNSYDEWSWDWTSVNAMGFTFDSKGRMFGTQAGTDTYTPNNKTSRFRLISSTWGKSLDDFSTASFNDNNTCYSRKNALRLEYMGLNNQGPNKDTFIANPKRFVKPKLAASTPDANVTNLYLLYYDQMTNEIRLRAGAIDNSVSFNNSKWDSSIFSQSKTAFGDFVDDAYRSEGITHTYDTNYNHCSVLSSDSTAYRPSSNYAIAVVPGTNTTTGGVTSTTDVVVAVWFDSVNNSLWYSYMENPLVNNHENVDGTTHVNTSWHTPVPIISGNALGHCAIAVDDDKHIHIVGCSKADTGSLIYTYLDTYNSSFSAAKNSCVVDSYGAVGWYLNIDFAKNEANGRTIPYISYYSASIQMPKYAYLVDTASSGKNGATWAPKAGADESCMFTGAWETITLPVQSQMLSDYISIGLYRDSDGVKKEIPVRPGNPGTITGTVGGNGTSNPVLSYGIVNGASGYIETAQMK